VMEAAATRAPEESWTVPRRVPWGFCAKAGIRRGSPHNAKQIARIGERCRMGVFFYPISGSEYNAANEIVSRTLRLGPVALDSQF
jgi:hypothetical protein